MKQIIEERQNDIVIDQLKGCRSGKNTVKPVKERSGGVCAWMTLSGFLIFIKEYIHRETSTEVILDTYEALTRCSARQQYYERLECLGYDAMCNLLGRLLNIANKGWLTPKQSEFWHHLLDRLYCDKFHVSNHKCKYCHIRSKKCLLNPKLSKFKKTFPEDDQNKINDEV